MIKRKSLEEVMHFMKQNGLQVNTIIDVGIAYGTAGLYGPFEQAKYHLIEPLKEYQKVIEKICAEYDATYTLAAAGEELGKLELNVHPDLSGSSLLKESEGAHVDGEPRTVPVTTIDHEVSTHNLKGPFLIKVDVQGFELQVLNGATDTLAETEVVLLEVSLIEFYQGSPTFADVIAYMNDRGFSAYEIYTPMYRPLDDAMGQVDIAFVKTNGVLRRSSHYATREQREEMTQKRIKSLNPKS